MVHQVKLNSSFIYCTYTHSELLQFNVLNILVLPFPDGSSRAQILIQEPQTGSTQVVTLTGNTLTSLISTDWKKSKFAYTSGLFVTWSLSLSTHKKPLFFYSIIFFFQLSICETYMNSSLNLLTTSLLPTFQPNLYI